MPKPLAVASVAFGALASLSAQDPAALQRAIEELRQRVADLEEQQAKTDDRLDGRAIVHAYTAKSFDFGGHVTSLFTHMRGEHGNATGHVASLIEFFTSATLDEQWSLFATPGFYIFHGALLDDPTTTTTGDPALIPADTSSASTLLSRLYAQWKNSDALQLQGGIVGSPHGTTNREYFIPARIIGEGNLHTRVFLANQLYPQHLMGIRASGKLPIASGGHLLEYDAYCGVEDDSPDDGIAGARLAWVFGDHGPSVALNYGRGTRRSLPQAEILTNVPALQSPFPSEFNGGRDYEFVGVDFDWRRDDFICKTEAYVSAEGPYDDQRALSMEFTWFALDKVGLSYRFDYFDSGSDQVVTSLAPFTTAEAARGHATEHVIGICFDPDPSVRLRLDFHHSLLPNSDESVDFVNFGWSVSF